MSLRTRRSMVSMLDENEICSLLSSFFSIDCIIKSSKNWFNWDENLEIKMVYVSQCKPSSFSKGNWYYEFFHTFSSKSMEKITENSCKVILIDYATKRYAILDTDDINWVYENSSRVRKKGGAVTDFVIRGTDSEYYLEPSLAGTRLYRTIEVRGFQ